jgi:sugar lactone lactonase YvrE
MTRSFNCASCSAPLEFSGEVMQKCEHCGSTVIAPNEMFYAENAAPFGDLSSLHGRALKIAEIQQLIHDGKKIEAIKEFRETFSTGLKEAKDAVEAIERGESINISGMQIQAANRQAIKIDGEAVKNIGKTVGSVMVVTILASSVLLIGLVAAILFFTVGRTDTKRASNTASQTPTPEAKGGEASPAQEVLKIGGEGNGPGRFKDNRHVTVDGKGRIYSSDYSPFRIQIFDAEGKFLSQWNTDAGTNLYDLAADRDGNLFIASDKGIFKYEGETGKLIAKAERVYPRGMALSWDGKVIVTAGRSMSILDNSLKPITEIKDAAERANSTFGFEAVAVDGDGVIYAIDRTADDICKFTMDGKFLNRFPTGASSPNAIAIDPQGRIFVSETSRIRALDSSGKGIKTFDAYQAFGLAFNPAGELFVASRPHVIKYVLDF